MAKPARKTKDLFDGAAVLDMTREIRWNQTQQRFELKAWQPGPSGRSQAVFVPYVPRHIKPFKASKALPVDHRRQLSLSRLTRRARYASRLPEHKRNTADRMDIAAWNITWRCIKRSRPGFAALLQDPNVKCIIETFNAELMLDV